jgi:hypothetical protein
MNETSTQAAAAAAEVSSADEPNAAAPSADAPSADAPSADAPSADAPSADAPSADAPSADAPSADAPSADAPSARAPSVDAPSADAQDAGGTAGAPSEDELRAAYEAELNRITSADLVLQTAASLLNLGARRLGLTGGRAGAESERDLEQVRDAIDGVRALMPILERRHAGEVGQLRDALSQLQMAYAREAPRPTGEQKSAGEQAAAAAGESKPGPAAQQSSRPTGPGPAETSGRLWVPGR